MNTNPAPAHIGDKYWGKGGRYVVNTLTGERELADQPEAIPATDLVATDAGAGDPGQTVTPLLKGKSRG